MTDLVASDDEGSSLDPSYGPTPTDTTTLNYGEYTPGTPLRFSSSWLSLFRDRPDTVVVTGWGTRGYAIPSDRGKIVFVPPGVSSVHCTGSGVTTTPLRTLGVRTRDGSWSSPRLNWWSRRSQSQTRYRAT